MSNNHAFGDSDAVKKDLEDSGIVTNEAIEAKKAEIDAIKEDLKNVGVAHNKTELTKALNAAVKELQQLETKEKAARAFGECAAELTVDSKGRIEPTEHNYEVIVAALADLAYEVTSGRMRIRKDLPWERKYAETPYWCDGDTEILSSFLSGNGIIVNETKLRSGIRSAAKSKAFNPIQDMFNSLPKWDGIYRLPGLLKKYLNAKDIILPDGRNYADEILKMHLVATYKLAMGEKVKYDMLPWFVGAQNRGKSSLWRRLAIRPENFIDSLKFDDFIKDGGKPAVEKLRGKMIAELPECNLSRDPKKYEAVKGFISQEYDTVRFCYDRDATDVPRTCTMVGTTNNENNSLLPDPTGNRRFPIIQCEEEAPEHDVYTEFTVEESEQVWAEVIANYLDTPLYFKDGDPLYEEVKRQAIRNLKTDNKEWAVRKGLSIPIPESSIWKKMSENARRDYIFKATISKIGLNKSHRNAVCLPEVFNEVFSKDVRCATQTEQNQVKLILNKIGLIERHSRKRFGIYDQQPIWWEIPAAMYEPGGELEFREDSVPQTEEEDYSLADITSLENKVKMGDAVIAMQEKKIKDLEELLSDIQETCDDLSYLPAGKVDMIKHLINNSKDEEEHGIFEIM